MKNISDYELGELGNLLADLRNRIADYSHIGYALPKELLNIEGLLDEVIDEENFRVKNKNR